MKELNVVTGRVAVVVDLPSPLYRALRLAARETARLALTARVPTDAQMVESIVCCLLEAEGRVETNLGAVDGRPLRIRRTGEAVWWEDRPDLLRA